jgi:tRNA(Arg) A34 adenosine deaminase TadA
MCLGAVPWSGVSRLICGARDEDARRIGFDEGSKPTNWIGELEQRGIVVVRDVLRQKAVKVLEEYKASGGPIYNTGQRAYSYQP